MKDDDCLSIPCQNSKRVVAVEIKRGEEFPQEVSMVTRLDMWKTTDETRIQNNRDQDEESEDGFYSQTYENEGTILQY